MNKKALRILLLADAASFHTERFAAELICQGNKVLTASLESGDMESIQLKRKGLIRQLHYLNAIPEICELAASFQPDIISAHFASGYGHIAAKVKEKTRLPLTVNLWGSDILIVPHKSLLHKKKIVAALQNADFIFADSQYLIDKAQEIYSFKKYSVIPWGIEKKYLNYRKESFLMHDPLKILIPRAQEGVYNNQFIVEALQPLLKLKKISLTFPSFGSQFNRFKDFLTNDQIQNVYFYDKFSRADYLRFAAGFDVYLSASLSDSSPVSLIEAMALGLLPVAGDIPGVKEWLTGKNGFLFDLEDKNSLLSAINTILAENENYDELRRNNFDKVDQEAIFETNIEKQLTVFRSLIGAIE